MSLNREQREHDETRDANMRLGQDALRRDAQVRELADLISRQAESIADESSEPFRWKEQVARLTGNVEKLNALVKEATP